MHSGRQGKQMDLGDCIVRIEAQDAPAFDVREL
jgi:hypothetical protein